MGQTVAEVIKDITLTHINDRGLVLGQCLTAVGWVGGTVPEVKDHPNLVELSMADVAGGGIAVGAALAGRRPIYIVRYQGFQWYNCASIINYAAKSKDMWGIPCPIFVRSIAMEGGIGPVAGSCHHSIFTRMPGMFVCAPFTPNEYREVWDWFMRHDEPLYVSEHRKSFNIDYEIKDIRYEYADITLFCISATRLYALEAVKVLREEYGLWVNLVNLVWLKPFAVKDEYIEMLNASKYGGLIIDDDFINGCMKTIAYDLMTKTKVPIGVLGLDERAAGFVASKDNLCPDTDKIVNKVTQIIRDQL